jgi:hypothetical protein
VKLAEAVGMQCDEWQLRALRSPHPRQLYNCCRQSGKSTVAAVRAIHRVAYFPGSLVLLLSPSQRQSQELFLKCLAIFKAIDRPVESTGESATTLVLANGSRLISLPGTEGTTRGYSAVSLLIVDESSRVDDAVIAATRPQLAVSGGTLIALSTPAGPSGWWAQAWNDGGAEYERFRVPATDVPRITPEFLASERAALGPHLFSAEYECAFVSGAFSVFDEAALQAVFTTAFAPTLSGA